MRFFSYVGDAWKTILANKMRSGLSTLGIVIGMASVIVMMAIGQGAEESLLKSMQDMIKNKITITADGGYSRWDEQNNQPGAFIKKVSFTQEIIPYIEKYFPDLTGKVTYQVRGKSAEVKIGRKSEFVELYGVPKNRFTLNERKIVEGTMFSQEHYDKNALVAIVNDKFKQAFFKNKSPIGKKFMFENKEYTIIGVLKSSGMDWSNDAIIPDSTVFNRITRSNEIQSFEVFLEADADNTLWKNRLTYLLLRKYNQPNKDAAGFNVSSFADFTENLKKSSNMMKYFLLFIGGVSLLVGGIGVMNIMIVSVTERTREIGIRKAIGALNVDIILQFLVESVVITLIGGVIAFGLSYLIVHMINSSLAGSPDAINAVIDQKTALVAFCLTAGTGILFGILPARKAAQLKPIDALRFE